MTRAGRRAEGFTLLEILVVVFLIALLSSALSLGNLAKLSNDIEDVSGQIEAGLRYASERAASTGTEHAFEIDLKEQRFRLLQEVELEPEEPARREDAFRPPDPPRELQPVPSIYGRWIAVESQRVLIEAVEVGGDRYQADTVRIGFGGDGSSDDAAVLLLSDNGARRTLRVLPFTGEVTVREGDPNA